MTESDAHVFLNDLRAWLFSDPRSSLYDEMEIAVLYECLIKQLMKTKIKCSCND